MEKLKKVLALVLAALMLLAVAGCDNNQGGPSGGEKDPITLTWWYYGNGEQEDTAKVEARVNELIKTYPGLEHVTLDLHPVLEAEYATKVQLALSGHEQIDILCTVALGSLGERVADGIFIPLDDLMSENLKKELPDWLWKLGSIDGSIYMVPNYQNAFNSAFLVFPKEYMDKYGNYEEMTAILSNPDASYADVSKCLVDFVTKVRAGEGDGKYLCPVVADPTGSLGFPFVTPYDHLGNYFMVESGTNEVKFLYEMEGIKEVLAMQADWFAQGLLSPDGIATDYNNYNKTHMLDEVSFVYSTLEQVGTAETVADIYSASLGFETVAIKVQDFDYVQNTWAAGGNGITALCEHPEEAAMILELVTTGTDLGKEIYNTMVFGLEGEHYKKDPNDPNRIETLEYSTNQGNMSTSYAAFKWCLGNSFYAYKNQAVLDGQFENIKIANESKDTVSSNLPGFVADFTPVSTQTAQVVAVAVEYYGTFYNGVAGADFEKYYEECMNKMEIAGLAEVKAELQRQLDEWLKAQK